MPFPSFATPGFSDYGLATNPVQLHLQARTDLPGSLLVQAFPDRGYGPLTVQFTILPGTNKLANGTGTAWDFGDGTAATGVDQFAIEHTFKTVSATGYVTRFTYKYGSTTAKVFVMPSPGPGNSPYPENFSQVFFTGGGTIPTNFAAQVALPYPADGPPQLASLLMIQHADCGSFDIDRAPKTDASGDFFTDGFTVDGRIVAGTNSVPVNAVDKTGGFKEEDSSYYLAIPSPWDCPVASTYTRDSHVYRPLPESPSNPTCASQRYRMVCNIGPQIVPPSNAEVYALPRIEPIVPAAPDPLLANGREDPAAARDLRLVVGPLAWSWNLNKE
jgi:hypothetical protein